MERSELVIKLEAIDRKVKLMYYIDAERMIADLLHHLKAEEPKEKLPYHHPFCRCSSCG